MKKSQALSNRYIHAMVETAMLVAIAFVLSYFRYEFAYGGSITPASMLPILIIGIRRGPGWGFGGALCYSLLQMLQGIYPPPVAVQDSFGLMLSFALVVALDYIIAFTVLGASGFFSKKKNGILYAVPICCVLRFLCHFASGVLIWGEYAWDGFPVGLYSFCYNGIYMGIELIICLAVSGALVSKASSIFQRQE